MPAPQTRSRHTTSASSERSRATWEVLRALAAPVGESGASGTVVARVPWFLWLWCVGCLAFGLVCLYAAWWEPGFNAWMIFWLAALLALSTTATTVWPHARRGEARRREAAAALREAILAGDASSAPLAAMQPEQSPATLLPEVTARPVYSTDVTSDTRHMRWLTWISVGLGSVFIGGEQLFTYFSSLQGHDWQGLFIGVMLPAWGVVSAVRGWLQERPFAVTAEAGGLTWRRLGRRHSIPWHEVRAVCMIEAPPPGRIGPALHPVYWIIGGRERLLWVDGPGRTRWRWARSQASSASDDDPAWLLCGVISARTGRPLRDATLAVATLAADWNGLGRRTSKSGPSSAAPAWADPQRTIFNPLGLLLGQVAFVTALATILAGIGVLVEQPRLYATQIEQAEHTAPLVADPLAKPTGLWPTGTFAGNDYSYSGGAYVLSQSVDTCCELAALASPMFGDAVVTVTVRQFPTRDDGEAGLIVGVDPAGSSGLVFFVEPGGRWQLEPVSLSNGGAFADFYHMLETDWSLFPDGAIHQGSGAAHRLAVLIRGGSYAFFINGQFAAVYHGNGPTHGRLGLFAEGLDGHVAFSDFAVYRAPPASLLLPA